MGTPKGLICRKKVGDTNKLDVLSGQTKTGKYYDQSGTKMKYIDPKEFQDGLGKLEDSNGTISASKNYRLYEMGYCPIKYDATGLNYDTGATYFVRSGDGSANHPYTYASNSCKV